MRPGGGFGCLATIFAWFSIGAVLFYVLLNFAAGDVKSDPKYVLFYLVMGYAFAAVNTIALRLYGWKVPDMFERRNKAAHALFYTATLASVCAYAGANIGDGPGFYVVIYCAALAHIGLYTLVVAHAALNRTVYRILVDRDRGVAFRAGCMFVAIGAILGGRLRETGLDSTLPRVTSFVSAGRRCSSWLPTPSLRVLHSRAISTAIFGSIAPRASSTLLERSATSSCSERQCDCAVAHI
jgi:hypothetical protein